jgi:putative ATPase
LRRAIESGTLPSIILWGPPGVGKTTLASIISQELKRPFYTLSAINSGVKDIREIIDKVQNQGLFGNNNAILFIDEIHRFSKSQQDSLLNAVEKGIITLIGATTENPSFEVISALLSRCQVYVLKSLERDYLEQLLQSAIQHDIYLKKKTITLKETEALLQISGGDARKLLNGLEIVVNSSKQNTVEITNEFVKHVLQENIALYDKSGDQHYDIASALIKSIRGSDPNAAVYWLARMIEGGEDPKFIARRLLIAASEDIGNANPTALVMANTCFQAVSVIGYPESRIILSQTVVYLATSPKSNASYVAINDAQELVRKTGNLPVPLHIRNAPTKLMKELGYGKEYQYSHSYENNFSNQEFLPEEIKNTALYTPGNNAKENSIREFLKSLWKGKYGY